VHRPAPTVAARAIAAFGEAQRMAPSSLHHLSKLLRYGTERYPEKVARGLLILNAASLGNAVFALGFALYDAVAGLWTLVTINLLYAIFMVGIPLWHRLGPLAAPLAFLVASYASIFVICSMLGTDCGMQVQYLAIAAGAVLVVGTDRPIFLAVTGSVAVALFIALEILVPADTGLLTKRQMLENFAGCIVGTSLILFAIVFYAVRQTARAEEVAEREYTRSETLLRNILPRSDRRPPEVLDPDHSRQVRQRVRSVRRHGRLHDQGQSGVSASGGPAARQRIHGVRPARRGARAGKDQDDRRRLHGRQRRSRRARGPCAGFGTLCSRHAPGHREPPRPARRCGADPDRDIERPAGGGRRG
jgi:hypothetical protein